MNPHFLILALTTSLEQLLELPNAIRIASAAREDGHQPKTLSLIWLKNNLLPPDWDEQHALFDEFDA